MKLTESYAYGGAELAVQTINANFGTDIREYATVTFKGMAEIIDAAGGRDGGHQRRGAGIGQWLDLGAVGRLRDGGKTTSNPPESSVCLAPRQSRMRVSVMSATPITSGHPVSGLC